MLLQAGAQATLAPLAGGAHGPARVTERPQGVSRTRPEPPRIGPALLGSGYGQLRARQDDLNELAQAIRKTGARVDIHKLYPPYPPEQEASMAYLDQISGLRRQIEALMFPVGRTMESGAVANDRSDALAQDISLDSRRLLAGTQSIHAISTNRPLLEVVARIDPVQ